MSAHGASRGYRCGEKEPWKGRHNRPQRSYAPEGAPLLLCAFPWLAPWADFFRSFGALRAAECKLSGIGLSSLQSRQSCRLFPGLRRMRLIFLARALNASSCNETGTNAHIEIGGGGPKLVAGTVDQSVRQCNLFMEGAEACIPRLALIGFFRSDGGSK